LEIRIEIGNKMIINLRFGYAARHSIYYDTQQQRGTIKLWSSNSGSMADARPIENREGFLSQTLFRVNQHTEFLIADEKDILSILAALAAVLNGDEFSFTSKEGRKITLSLKREGKWEKEIVTAKIQYGRTGKLTIGEARKLHTIAREILRNLGHSDQEISKNRPGPLG
jgi:hypothetical protein